MAKLSRAEKRSITAWDGITGRRRERLFYTGMALAAASTVFPRLGSDILSQATFQHAAAYFAPSSARSRIHVLAHAFPYKEHLRHKEHLRRGKPVPAFIVAWGS